MMFWFGLFVGGFFGMVMMALAISLDLSEKDAGR